MNGTVQFLSFCNWLISLPCYIMWKNFLIFMAGQYSIPYAPYLIHVYHIFFIHLSAKSAGLLLPFVNIAMIDMVCKDFFDILLWILGLYTQEWDYWVDSSSIVNFLRHLHTVSLETVPFYVSIHSMQRFQLLHIFANSDYFVCLFVWQRPSFFFFWQFNKFIGPSAISSRPHWLSVDFWRWWRARR